MNEIELPGCRPRPLASYLKALAVLRLVSEQADSKARGFWRGDRFVLRTALDEENLVEFFLHEYAPTPIVSPWNGGSGFYDGDATDGLDAIRSTTHQRFEAYRRVIEDVFAWPEMPRRFCTIDELLERLAEASDGSKGKKKEKYDEQLGLLRDTELAARDALGERVAEARSLTDIEALQKGTKGKAKKVVSAWWKEVKKARTSCVQLERGGGKQELIAVCRAKLPESSLAWLDSAIVRRADGDVSYNPVLGTGGNEGRLDFANNFMQHVATLLIQADGPEAITLLRSTMFAEPHTGLTTAAIGQFDPGRAGGFNQGIGVESKSFTINPWDYVFSLEGASSLSSAVTRRHVAGGHGFASLPFTVTYKGVGFSSSAEGEDGKAEAWLPLWRRPTGYGELRFLFGEGRSTVKGRQARDGLDFARAVASLGVDRGIESFERFAFLERRGKSYVAMPAGRLEVRYRPEIRLLDDLDPLLARLDGFLRRFKSVPATFASVRRRIDTALYDCAVRPNPVRFSSLVRALGQMEALLAQRDRSHDPKLSRPLGGLSFDWIRQCDDGGPEIRLAAALASIRGTGKVGPIRSNLAGVDAARPWQWAKGHGQRRWRGVDFADRLGGVLEQRLMDAARLSAPVVPTYGRIQISPRDVVPFLLGDTDDRRLEELLWGLSLVDWHATDHSSLRDLWREPLYAGPVPRGWSAMKLLHRPARIRDVAVSVEPRITALLRSRRPAEAVALAHHRLRVSGVRPLPVEAETWLDPVRQLAGLLVPTRKDQRLEGLILEDNQDTESKTNG